MTSTASLTDPARLQALQRTELLDSPPDEAFDRLSRVASQILRAPVALVCLVDDRRQFFMSAVGLAEPWASRRETPLSHSFCQHVVSTGQPLVVEDARSHPLVKDNLAIPDLGVIAYAGVPLTTREGHTLGSFCVIDGRPHSWTDEAVQFLKDLADSVMTEIELRARVHEVQAYAQEIEAEMARRQQMAEALSDSEARKTAVMEAALDAILTIDHTGRVREYNRAAEQIFGYRREEIIGRPITERIVPPSLRAIVRKGIARYLATGEGLVLNRRFEVTARRADDTEIPVELAIIPVRQWDQPMFIAYTRDISESKRAERRLEAQHLVARILAEADTIQIAVQRILKELGECLEWTWGEMWGLEGAPRELRCMEIWRGSVAEGDAFEALTQQTRLPFGVDLPGRVWQQEIPIWIPDLAEDSLSLRSGAARALGLHGAVAFPIRGENEILGCMLFFSRRVLPPDEEMSRIVASVGSQIGQFLQRKQAEAALAAARENEVALGARIQQTLLVRQPPGHLAGFQVAARSQASQRIDGDFYDFFTYDPDRFDFLIGDVMGKGVLAALLGAAGKSQFQRAIRRTLLATTEYKRLPDPDEILAAVHATMTRELIALESFITLCYARFDRKHNEISLIDCGHTRTIHYHARTGECSLLQGDNLPLGVREVEVYETARFRYEPGDLFFFYSDGVTDTRSIDGEFFGEERLVGLIQDWGRLKPQELIDELFATIRSFSSMTNLPDDLTCVAIRVGGEQSVKPLCHLAREYPSDLTELDHVRRFIRWFCKEFTLTPLGEDATEQVVLAINEALTNIIKHAYAGRVNQRIQIVADGYDDHIDLQLFDWGRPFDADTVAEPDFDGSRDHGFGMFIIQQCMDEVSYTHDELGRNCLRLTKRTSP